MADDEELTVQQRAEIQYNRLNVALAKNQRLLQSYVPPRSDGDAFPAEAEENEDDFTGMIEAGGIQARNAYSDEGMPEGAFKRYDVSSNSKLLEQMIGKKAAQEKRKQKEREAGKGRSASKHAAPKSAVAKESSKRQEESEDEEEGRAAAFRSKKAKVSHNSTAPSNGVDSKDTEYAQGAVEPASGPPRKKKAASYLDELLASKKSKKKKNR